MKEEKNTQYFKWYWKGIWQHSTPFNDKHSHLAKNRNYTKVIKEYIQTSRRNLAETPHNSFADNMENILIIGWYN